MLFWLLFLHSTFVQSTDSSIVRDHKRLAFNDSSHTTHTEVLDLNSILILGGLTTRQLVEHYDFSTGKWTRRKDVPNPGFYGGAATTYDGLVYVLDGGFAGSYDPAKNIWTPFAPGYPFFAAATVFNDLIYLTGGYTYLYEIVSNEVFFLDMKEDKWQRAADMNIRRRNHHVGVAHGKLYAVGGQESKYNSDDGTSTVEVYDLQANSWTFVSTMYYRRKNFCLEVVDDKIYVIGGYNAKGTTEVYDPLEDSWTLLASMPAPIEGASSVTYNGLIYVMGGSPGIGFINTIYEYDPKKNVWTISPIVLPMERYLSSSVLV